MAQAATISGSANPESMVENDRDLKAFIGVYAPFCMMMGDRKSDSRHEHVADYTIGAEATASGMPGIKTNSDVATSVRESVRRKNYFQLWVRRTASRFDMNQNDGGTVGNIAALAQQKMHLAEMFYRDVEAHGVSAGITTIKEVATSNVVSTASRAGSPGTYLTGFIDKSSHATSAITAATYTNADLTTAWADATTATNRSNIAWSDILDLCSKLKAQRVGTRSSADRIEAQKVGEYDVSMILFLPEGQYNKLMQANPTGIAAQNRVISNSRGKREMYDLDVMVLDTQAYGKIVLVPIRNQQGSNLQCGWLVSGDYTQLLFSSPMKFKPLQDDGVDDRAVLQASFTWLPPHSSQGIGIFGMTQIADTA